MLMLFCAESDGSKDSKYDSDSNSGTSVYNIHETSFEEQKEGLKNFALSLEKNIKIEKVGTDGDFIDFLADGFAVFGTGHRVTGKELNNLITQLQKGFEDINERDKEFAKGLYQVYETFTALDEQYIQGILIGVKGAEKAKRKADKAFTEARNSMQLTQKLGVKVKDKFSNMNNIEKLNLKLKIAYAIAISALVLFIYNYDSVAKSIRNGAIFE